MDNKLKLYVLLDSLQKEVESFLDNFDASCYLSSDFECYTDAREVGYALFVPQECSDSFMARVNRLYPDIKASEFLWSLLHEVGHLETYDTIPSEVVLFCRDVKNNSPTDEVYYELEDEFLATEWAANFMRDNFDLVNEFWGKASKLFQDIYALD